MIHYNPTVSGSLVVTGSLIVTQQISGTITASYVDFNSIANKPTLVSGSAQTIANLPTGTISGSIQVLGGTGIVSGSSQISYTGLSNIPADIISSSQQLPQGLVSGSSQILGGSGVISGSSQITYTGISSIPSGIVSGSSQIDITSTTGYSTFSGSIATSISASNVNIASLSSSVYTSDNIQNGRLNNLESKSASVDISISNINSFTASNDNTSLNSYTSSQNTKNTTLASYTGSNDIRLTSIENKTGSLATTGSNTFFGTQTFSGSVYIANDLVVQGSSSIQYISASSVSIGTNIIQLNTANPSVRFAGLSIIDSGSVGGSGSFLYDSVQDEFIFLHRGNGVNITSSHFVLGPETYDNLGNETYLTNNILPKGTGKEHLNDSNITDTGTLITLGSNTSVSGMLTANGLTGSIAATNGVVSGSSQITYANISSIPGGIVSGSSQTIANLPTGTVSGSSQITYANISSIPGGIVSGSSQTIANLPTGTVSGSSQIVGILSSLNTYTGSNDTTNTAQNARLTTIESVTGSYETKGSGIVSGSSQINVMSTTNIARLATTGSNIFIGNQTITGSLFVSGSNTGGTPLVAFRASGTGTFQRGIQLLNPGMGNGDSIMYSVGKADNSKNMGQFYFHHAGDSSNNNRISVGLHSVDDVFNIMGSNEVLIGTTTTNSAGKLQVAGNIVPEANGTRDLGSTSYRWSTVYTSDLSLNNGIGDWTIVEGEDDLFLYNNKKGKVYKFALTEVDPNVATPKKS